MARRIDIELTSNRDDGTWTWRAQGAKEPRGSLDGSLLPAGARVGDVLRAEAEFEIDGIFVTSVQPPKEAPVQTGATRTLEVLGSGRGFSSGVSVTLAPGSRRRREDESRPRPAGRRARPARSELPQRAQEEVATGARRTRGVRPDRGVPPERAQRAEGRQRAERLARQAERAETAEPGRARPAGPSGPSRDRRERRRLEPLTTNRNLALAQLRPEQLPVAEQLLRGGIPAVRRAIEEQNTRARSEGRAEISPEPLMAMAEELLPVMNLANWKDRALSVRSAGRDAPLREVRSVVSGASTVALDEEARSMLVWLRESLESRVTALREAWVGRIGAALDSGRVADALRTSSRPPEPGARLPAELAVRLAADASTVMAADLAEEKWGELLDAVVESPVRRNVKPSGLPTDPSEELLRAARRAAGFVPELARLLGLPIPPPPGPRRPAAAAARRV